LFERKPLFPLTAPRGVGEHGMRMQLRVEIATGIVKKHRTEEISREPVLIAHRRVAQALAHRREAFHFREGDLDRLCEDNAHPFIAADHRQHAHVFGRGKLDVEERDPIRVIARRERLTRER
jgi:hypothetical protein